MRRPTFLALSIRLLAAGLGVTLSLFVLAGAGTNVAEAAPHERRFFSARHGVGVDAPTSWTISQHTGYPSILVLLLHPNGSRISVSAAPTTAADARALAEQNRRALEIQRLAITKVSPGPRGGVQVEARNAHGDELRQLYIVRALPNNTRQAVVITLVAKTDTLAAAAPGYEWTVAHLALEAPAGSEEAAPDGGTREAPGGGRDGGAAPGARGAPSPAQRPTDAARP
jgi:hypothetical protein